MDRSRYDAYLARFNARDYDGVLGFFTGDPEIVFAGYAFRGRQAVKDFYAFFHHYVSETILIERFVADESTLAIEARVRLVGLRDLDAAALAAKGLERLRTPRKGETIEIPQFIHYHIRDGKFARALCAVFEEPLP